MVAPPPLRWFTRRVLWQLRQREDVAPHPPRRHDLVVVATHAQGNRQGWIAMSEDEHLGIVSAAQRNAEKIAHANVDRHPHAMEGTPQNHAFAVKFYPAHAAVGAAVMRIEADGQSERVEPQDAARPGGIDPAYCSLTPHGFISPPGLYSRSTAETLPERHRFRLKKAG